MYLQRRSGATAGGEVDRLSFRGGRRSYEYIFATLSRTVAGLQLASRIESDIGILSSYQRYDLSWFCDQTVRQLLIVFDQVTDVNVTVELLQQCVLPQLISKKTSLV